MYSRPIRCLEQQGLIKNRLIDLRPATCKTWSDRLLSKAAGPIEKLLQFDKVNDIHDASALASNAPEFLHRILDYLEISFRLPASDLSRIPKTGPLLVVSYHPFGAIDGIILAAALCSVRSDVKVMANYLLGQIKGLRDLFILVDAFGGDNAASANLSGTRESLRWLKNGGLLAAFPAGEVAHLSLKTRQIRELEWSQSIARIARRSGVPVLPIYFDGRNSATFQILGLVHPRVRTALLAREVWNKRRRTFDLRVGSIIPARKLEAFEDDKLLAAHLRQRTLVLRHRSEVCAATTVEAAGPAPARFADVVGATDPARVACEIDALPRTNLLVDADEFQVFFADAGQIPQTLREIGRLREITFRATGEGTGKSIDLDEYDRDYVHLFVWNKLRRELVGAYRLGATDKLLKKFGPAGFYTRTLFNYDAKLLNRIGTGLEMGRSFVRAEYQKAYTPLLYLWKGIGTYCVKHPQYKTLFGPVSISNDYQTVSKQLMVRFLKANHCPADSQSLVRPRKPFRAGRRISGLDTSPQMFRDGEEIAQLIAEVEPDRKGIPVLIRQYLKLGAKMLAFNVDPAFNDAIDGLIIVDLTQTEPRVLSRYMGREGYAEFMQYHAERGIVYRGEPATV